MSAPDAERGRNGGGPPRRQKFTEKKKLSVKKGLPV